MDERKRKTPPALEVTGEGHKRQNVGPRTAESTKDTQASAADVAGSYILPTHLRDPDSTQMKFSLD